MIRPIHTGTRSHYCQAVRCATLCVGLLAVPAAQATVFEELGEVQRAQVVEICLPVRYNAGVEAWRTCVEREAVALTQSADSRSSTVPSANTAARLSLDERFALEKLCANGADQLCTSRALVALERVAAPTIDDLRDDERHALARACFSVQNTRGPAAWRSCISEQAARLRTTPPVDLNALGLADRNRALNACSAGKDVSDYRTCLNQSGAPLIGAITTSTVTTNRTNPDVGLVGRASNDVSASRVLAPGEAALDSVTNSSRAASTARAAIPDSNTESDLEAAVSPDSAVQPAQPVEQRPQIAATERVVSVPAAESSAAGEPGGGLADTTEAQGEKTIIQRLTDTVNGLDTTGRTALLAAALLPLLALLGVMVARNRPDDRELEADGFDREWTPYDRAPAQDRFRPETRTDFHVDAREGDLADARAHEQPPEQAGTRQGCNDNRRQERQRTPDTEAIRSRFSDEADELFDALDATVVDDPLEFNRENVAAGSESLEAFDGSLLDDSALDLDISEHEIDYPDTYPVYPPASPSDTPTRLVIPTDGRGDLHADDTTHAAIERPAGTSVQVFASWLQSEPETLRLQHAIELLIYWVAYADDRYDPALKRAILSNNQPDSHDLIKTWVLRQDNTSLSASLDWLQHNASREQRKQVIELLIALLVTDATPTPVQNTLLRFFADVFGIGAERLNQIWIEAFDKDLPNLPRVDREDWWGIQDQQAMVERDARAIAKRGPEQQYLARLGLPLLGHLSNNSIENAWQLAAARCAAKRFDALGERERELAERQMARFDEAREGLLTSLADLDASHN